MSKSQYFPVLSGLRFVAAAQVLIFHAGMPLFEVAPSPINTIFNGGYESVLFFFVLSGFLLSNSHYNGRDIISSEGRKRYYISRFARIYPMYLLALIIAFPPFVYSALVAKIVDFDVFIPGLVLVPLGLQSWYPPTASAWTLPAWSLSVEISFYIVLPFLLLVVRRFESKIQFGIIVLMLLTFHYLQWHLANELDGVFKSKASFWNFQTYFPLMFLPIFLCGIWLARFQFDNEISSALANYSLIACIVFTITIFAFKSNLQRWVPPTLLLIPIFSLMILSATRAKGKIANLLASRPFITMGEASYALYILHAPMMFWWRKLGLPSADASLQTYRSVFIFCILACAISVLCHKFIEKPCFRAITEFSKRSLQPKSA